eukprot:XP_015128549.2 maestro heat-like repeat-containing protein family member 2B [Gallus gallus]
MELDSMRAHATCSALMLTHGSLALRASKEQLLARLEGDTVGNILLLYSCSCWLLQTSLKALGWLMAVLLKTETTSGFFQNIVHVLQRSMTSDNVWECKRTLQACSQLLAVCEELRVANGVIETGDMGSLCEGLHACSTVSQLQTSSKIARIVCRNFPLEHTVDFMMALKETFWRAKGMCVRAAGKWMITFLQMYGKDVCQDVPPILHILHSCMSCMQQSTFMPFLCQAVVILICCHEEVTIDNFSRLLGPTDRYCHSCLCCCCGHICSLPLPEGSRQEAAFPFSSQSLFEVKITQSQLETFLFLVRHGGE